MERLSDKAIEIINNLHTERLDYTSEYLPLIEAAQKLSAYEDTWLEPEEYKRHADAIKKLDIEHMHDLLQAEMDGRLVVLPCKVGDVAYVVAPGDYEHEHRPYMREKAVREISWKSTSTKDLGWGLILAGGKCNTSARYKLNSIGKTVFLTREEAEAALKKREEVDNEAN